MGRIFATAIFSLILVGCQLTSRNGDVSEGVAEIDAGKSLREITELGDKYVYGGPGVEPNAKKGVQYIKYAADKGYAPAMSALAGIYLNGIGVDKNPKLAHKLYTISANQGYGHSQFNLGVLLMEGREIPKDLESAYYYLSLASYNKKDLGELSKDAARLRDVCASQLPKSRTRYIDANLLLRRST
jgi:TPR repeat protein